MGATNLMLMAFAAAMAYKEQMNTQLTSHTYKGNVGTIIDRPGFEAFDSHLFYKTAKVDISKGGQLIDMLYTMSSNDFPSDFDEFQKEDWTNFFADVKEEQSYEIDTASMSINVAHYSQATGKLSFYTVFLTPDDNGEVINYEYLRVQCTLTLPGRFMIGSSAKKGWFSSSKSQTLMKIDASIEYTDVVDALSIALAPLYLGFMTATSSILEKLQALGINALAIEPNPTSGFI
ncbi:hypothetical protein TRFO_19636 [Tritrichomonas foetus]|uniref:Uncharacterized protein n=1 Tax=Tritrichomonas foetus TaxID=1144522 RepID=A0A1J4KHS1_9EUKA|nr:hypothetical protein TRFO_19636 [Tritrichomonas foetus]|eukprot:OHT10937.1 hypothetical protein TRFO_19636 [Tritrichomonas foetus]